ncbi:hypothetical protein ACFL3J_01575 [Candidatus Omnitrophota bacterium]
MRELKELLKFLLGFMPWILFLFLSGHTLASLERSIVICLLASLIFNFRDLRKGFILQWGTFIFFSGSAILVNLMQVPLIARNMGIIASAFLASIIWLTVLIGKPFTLQYARAERPKELWNNPELIRRCRFVAVIWGILLLISAAAACFKTFNPHLYPDWVYFDISIGIILGGIIFTILYKKHKRAKDAMR